MAVEPELVVAVAVEPVAVEEPELAAVALAGDQAAGEPVVAAVQEEPAVVPVEEVEQEPGRVAVMGLELVLVRLQGQALARARQPRSVLALALQLVQVRLAVPGLVQVPVHRSAQEPTRPSVLALAVLSVMEAVMDPLTELGTKVPGLKTEPALGLLRNVRQEQIKEQIVDCVTRCSLI